MYGLVGFDANVANIYRISVPFAAAPVRRISDLRPAYHAFIRRFHDGADINGGEDIVVKDPELQHLLLTRIAGSRLNDLDQEEMVGDDLDADECAARQREVEAALDFLREARPELFELLHLAVHSVAVSRSKRNRLGQRAHGGTSNKLIGLIWFALEAPLPRVDLLEMLVHELTHTLVFIDELNHGHFNYETLTRSEYWARSAILARDRPMDKVVHSICVSTEIVLARRSFIGEPETRRVHPSSAQLRTQTLEAIDSVLHHPRLEQVCLPRAIELLVLAQSSLGAH